MKALEFRLLNDFQRDFPLVPEPYAVLAGTLGVGEPEVLEAKIEPPALPEQTTQPAF